MHNRFLTSWCVLLSQRCRILGAHKFRIDCGYQFVALFYERLRPYYEGKSTARLRDRDFYFSVRNIFTANYRHIFYVVDITFFATCFRSIELREVRLTSS